MRNLRLSLRSTISVVILSYPMTYHMIVLVLCVSLMVFNGVLSAEDYIMMVVPRGVIIIGVYHVNPQMFMV